MMFAELLGTQSFFKHFIDSPEKFSLEEMREFVSNYWTGGAKAPKELRGERSQLKTTYSGSIERLKGKGQAQTTFPTLSFPVMPSKQEKIAMFWLLAAARSQPSGIEQLTVEKNILLNENEKTIQIVQERKNRQGKSKAASLKQGHESPIYKNDNHYLIYTKWIELIEGAKTYVDLGFYQ